MSQPLFSSTGPSCTIESLSRSVWTSQLMRPCCDQQNPTPYPHRLLSCKQQPCTQGWVHHTAPGSGLRVVWGRNSGVLFTQIVV